VPLGTTDLLAGNFRPHADQWVRDQRGGRPLAGQSAHRRPANPNRLRSRPHPARNYGEPRRSHGEGWPPAHRQACTGEADSPRGEAGARPGVPLLALAASCPSA